MMTFLTDENGAVTVDWVVLTAGLVGLGLATMSVVSGGVEDVSGDMQTQLERDGIIKTSFAPDVLARMQTMFGIAGGDIAGADTGYAEFQNLIANGDEAALTAGLEDSRNLQAMFESLDAMARAQYDATGSLDFDALSAEYAVYGETLTAEALETGFNNKFGGDADLYFTSYANVIAVEEAKQWHLEDALLSAGG